MHTDCEPLTRFLAAERIGARTWYHGDLEVGVVVPDRRPVLSRQHGGQQVGNAAGSMSPRSRQDALRIRRGFDLP
jgi:hypothetical protein